MGVLEELRTYRLKVVVRASSIAGGNTVRVRIGLYDGPKAILLNTKTLINGVVLSAANTWLTYTMELLPATRVRYGRISITKADQNFDVFVDYAGVVREPISFHAHLNSDQALVTGGYRLIEFDDLEALASGSDHNLGSNFNTTTHLFTAPYTAMYHFDTNVKMNQLTDGKYTSLRFYKNGASYKQGLINMNAAAADMCVNGSIMVELDRGDTFGVYVYHNQGFNRNAMGVADGEESWFSGFEVSR